MNHYTQYWQTNAWVNHEKYTYTYGANGNSITGKYEVWQSGNWDPGMGNLVLYSQQKYISGSVVYHAYRYEASFTSFINGIATMGPNTGSLSVFPNPASEKITIELSEPLTNVISSVFIYSSFTVKK